MIALSDIDFTTNVSGLSITNIAARDEAGNSLGRAVLNGTPSSNPADPEIFPLFPPFGAPLNASIPTLPDTYAQLGNRRNRDINSAPSGASWKSSTESVENVSARWS